MPILKDFRKTKFVELKAYPDSKIEVYNSLLVMDSITIDWKEENREANLDYVLMFIKSWNFTNEKGEILEIKKDNLKLLNVDAFTQLSKEITKFDTEVKKNS